MLCFVLTVKACYTSIMPRSMSQSSHVVVVPVASVRKCCSPRPYQCLTNISMSLCKVAVCL